MNDIMGQEEVAEPDFEILFHIKNHRAIEDTC